MRRGAGKKVNHNAGVRSLPADVQRWRAGLLPYTVNENTSWTYYSRARAVSALGGDYDYAGFMAFCAARDARAEAGLEKKLATSYLRQIKSACMHLCHLEGRSWGYERDADANEILTGRAYFDADVRPRGKLTAKRLRKVVARCEELELYDVADGLTVMYGGCTRIRDIVGMTSAHVNLKKRVPVVLVERKAPEQSKKDGRYTRNAVCTDEALVILREKVKLLPPGELFFPKWSSCHASRVIKEVAYQEGWPDDVQWCPYSARHGAAHDMFEESLQSAMERGNWKTRGSAIRYATSSNGPTRQARHVQHVIANNDAQRRGARRNYTTRQARGACPVQRNALRRTAQAPR